MQNIPGMARPRKQNASAPFKASGDRVRLLRKALKAENASVFAAQIGLSPSHLSNIESGNFDLTKLIALKIRQAVPGVDLDFLLIGDRAGLSYEMALRLAEAESKDTTTTRLPVGTGPAPSMKPANSRT